MAPATTNNMASIPEAGVATRKFAAWRTLGRKVDAQDPRAAREAAAMMTSQLFFAPLLAEMRKTPFGREFGHGGRMEDALGEQLDIRIADLAARADKGLTTQLASKLIRKSGRLPTPPVSWQTAVQARGSTEGES